MAVISIESGSESSGRVQGGAARSGDDSPSSVSSHFLEEAVGSSGADPEVPVIMGDRIFHGVPMFLLKGGIRVDGSPFEPDGQGVVVNEGAPYVPSLFASAYPFRQDLERRVGRTHIVRDVEDSRLIRAGVSLRNERVYYGKRASPNDFFYVYLTFFTHLHLRVPFTKFQMAVLREVNVAPTQLHPNSWAAVQAFLAMCLAVGVTPTIPVFFHFFEVRPAPSGGWVSFTSVRERALFRPFSDSFKNFKQYYFKIIIDATGRHEFHDADGKPLFPFYWTRNPRRIKAISVGALTASDLEAVRTINALPRRIFARYLVECLSLEDCGQKAFDMLMTTPIPRQSNFMASRKKTGASSSTARPTSVPTMARPPPAGRPSSGGRLPPVRLAQKAGVPPVDQTGGSGVKASGPDPQPDLAAIHVDPSSEAATASVAPLIRKRKDPAAEGRKDKEGSSSRSASKKARKGKDKEKDRERVPAVPLPGGIFSPAFSMSDRAKFHMSSSQRALIEPLTELELTNAMLEMSTRTSALAWYLKEFADRPGLAEVQAALDAEKKNSASLQLTMEQMLLTQDDYDQKIEQLEADLEKSKREAAEGLAAAREEQERLAEEGRQLKAEVTRLRDAEAERVKANEALTLDVAKAKEKITELESTIVFEHKEGFNKALRQVSLLAGVQDPYSLGVDIEKDVFYGVLVDLNAAEGDEPSVEAGAGGNS
ncbi:hypothetical protein LR48_Vigan08g060200 [Vigna angularis]|uniref:Transposase (putative) gypsy type domain-containing protein n=1 Tax=Phaseolus angularis TaxID=3914 RepID=A0A0L9V3W2_PHAAN|nr:hypothetical protein LR48_Vigan08g060200 [Vigna angularis]